MMKHWRMFVSKNLEESVGDENRVKDSESG